MSTKSCFTCAFFHPITPGEVYDQKLSPPVIGCCERYPPFYHENTHTTPFGWSVVIEPAQCGEWKKS